MKTTLTRIALIVVFLFSSQLEAQHKNDHTNRSQLISFSHQGDDIDIKKGVWSVSRELEGTALNLSSKKRSSNPFKKNGFFISFYPTQEELSILKNQQNELRIQRASGSLILTGDFDSNNAEGTFTFNRNNDFERFLNSQGIDDITSLYSLKLFLGNVDKAYVLDIKKLGYQPTIKQLSKLGLLGISTDYMASINETHYKGLELDMLIKFAIHGISATYIDKLAALGYGDLEANMLKKWAVHGISSNYIEALNEAGYKNLDADMIKKFAIHGISSKYIRGLNDLGYKNLEPNVIKNFAVHGISTKYIKSLLNSDIDRPTTTELRKAAVHGVSARFIEKAKNKGYDYDNLNAYTKLSIKGF